MPASQLPSHHNLFIATPNSIHLHSQCARRLLFECETPGGIINARAAKDNSCVLAVADSHVVILFNAEGGKEKKYRLKSGDGEPRLLLFSPSSRMLYFTTTLSHSIQAYSISTAQLLPPLPAHPSPPNVLVISRKGDLLLSASPTPPTVVLQDVRVAGSDPIRFFPSHSRSIVQCAAFLDDIEIPPQQFCLFVLGFQDGTLTLYRLAIPAASDASMFAGLHEEREKRLRQPVKLGSIKKLHNAAMGGICAAEFIPGFKARIVSIGHDGKCRIVDFERGGEVLRTWRVFGKATCLSVVTTGPFYTTGRRANDVILSHDGSIEAGEPVFEGRETLIAIGTEPSKVLVFNILGLLVHEIPIEAPIVALEWVGDMDGPSALPNPLSSSPISLLDSSPAFQPLLHMLMNEYEKDSSSDGEEFGTVHRTKPPLGHSFPTSPSPFQPANDLFSPHRDMSPNFVKRLSRKPTDTPLSSPRRNAKRPKKYPRPRIVTDTFTIPVSPPSSSFQSSPMNHSPPVIPVKSPARRWSHLERSPNLPLMPAAPAPEDDHSVSMYSAGDEEEARIVVEIPHSEIYVTPPTSHAPGTSSVMSPQRSVAYEARRPTQHVRFRASSPAMSVSFPPIQDSNRGSECQARSSPKTVDSDMGYRELVSSPYDSPSSSNEPQANIASQADERVQRTRELLKKEDPRDDENNQASAFFLSVKDSENGMKSDSEYTSAELPTSKQEAGPNVSAQGAAAAAAVENTEKGAGEEQSDSKWLRAEMRALRQEFVVLREAVLASRG